VNLTARPATLLGSERAQEANARLGEAIIADALCRIPLRLTGSLSSVGQKGMLRGLSDTAALADMQPSERVVPSLLSANLSRPKLNALLSWVNGVARRAFRHRVLVFAALVLALSECSILWLARKANHPAAGQTTVFASTVYYCFWLAIVAGWVRLGGWLDTHTQTLFEQIAIRRGFDSATCKRICTFAYFRWLSLLLAFPVIAVALLSMIGVTRSSELLAIFANSVLSLALVQIMASGVVFAVHGLERFELHHARRLWLLACIVPELARPLLPGLPTLRSLALAAEHAVLHWGLRG
jgi:hypothetical protein